MDGVPLDGLAEPIDYRLDPPTYQGTFYISLAVNRRTDVPRRVVGQPDGQRLWLGIPPSRRPSRRRGEEDRGAAGTGQEVDPAVCLAGVLLEGKRQLAVVIQDLGPVGLA
jgi:hypothetical protein